MKKIILINLLFLLFLACSHDTTEYTPAVVYLKSPQKIQKDGSLKTYFEFAVSDLNEEEGKVEITVTDENENQLLKKELDKLLFSTDGSIISFYEDQINSDKVNIKFNVCNTDKLCRKQEFKDIKINDFTPKDEVKITGYINEDDIAVYISSKDKAVYPENKTFEITLKQGNYDLYTKGKELKNGFYRYIYLKSLNFKSDSEIHLYIPKDENKEYNDSLVDCSFSTSNGANWFIFIMLILFAAAKRKILKN